jgi:hypothetical protein
VKGAHQLFVDRGPLEREGVEVLDYRQLGCGHARQVLTDWRHDYNHFRPHSSLGNRTPAEMGAGSVGKPGWGLTPNPVVAITPKHGHQTGRRLYS